MKRFTFSRTFMVLVLASCGSAPSKVFVDSVVEYDSFAPPKNIQLTANIGDEFIVDGRIARQKAIQILDSIDSKMPGAYGVPFSFEIEPTNLVLEFSRGEFDYYCAPYDSATASFPSLGVVVDRDDCIGIRKNGSTGELEWTVDNSYHNKANTVWHRKLKDEDGVRLKSITVPAKEKSMEYMLVNFDGYYSNLLHFTLEEGKGGRVSQREFKFDYPPTQGEPVYGIKGYRFKVMNVTNSSMDYLWIE